GGHHVKDTARGAQAKAEAALASQRAEGHAARQGRIAVAGLGRLCRSGCRRGLGGNAGEGGAAHPTGGLEKSPTIALHGFLLGYRSARLELRFPPKPDALALHVLPAIRLRLSPRPTSLPPE